MHIRDAQSIYCIGIGGIGLSGLSRLLVAHGKDVRGSDIRASDTTAYLEEHEIAVHLQQDGSGIRDYDGTIDMVVYSGAIPEDHPERQAATEAGIPQIEYYAALGHIAEEYQTVIGISGTHGKTTTTALVGLSLQAAGLDPTVLVGSFVPQFEPALKHGSNVRIGSREWLVIEVDEYQEHMMHVRPNMVVLTNLEADHLDYYDSMEHIRSSFQSYLNQLPEGAQLIVNAHDHELSQLDYPSEPIRFALSDDQDVDADLRAHSLSIAHGMQTFRVGDKEYRLALPGDFNVLNSMAAVALTRIIDEVTPSAVQYALSNFRGAWRRFQILGRYNDGVIITDYAHHPTAVRSTIAAAKSLYEGQRVVAVFQPHQRARTESLFDDFVTCMDEADIRIVQEIYDVVGRESAEDALSSAAIVKAMKERDIEARFTSSAKATRKALDTVMQPDDIVLIMGAGDIYDLAQSLVS